MKRFVANIGIGEKRLLNHSSESIETHESVHAAVSADTKEHLGGFTRLKESTLGAIKNVLQGAGRLIFVRGKRLKGAAQIAEGAFDALDIVPSAVADGVRSATGPHTPQKGPSQYNYNVSRALGSFKDIQKPTDAIGATVDVVHALGFRAGSDIVRAVGGTRNKASHTLAA